MKSGLRLHFTDKLAPQYPWTGHPYNNFVILLLGQIFRGRPRWGFKDLGYPSCGISWSAWRALVAKSWVRAGTTTRPSHLSIVWSACYILCDIAFSLNNFSVGCACLWACDQGPHPREGALNVKYFSLTNACGLNKHSSAMVSCPWLTARLTLIRNRIPRVIVLFLLSSKCLSLLL